MVSGIKILYINVLRRNRVFVSHSLNCIYHNHQNRTFIECEYWAGAEIESSVQNRCGWLHSCDS